MTVSVKKLIPARVAENTQTTQYTATNCKARIDKFTVTNIAAVNVLFSVNLVESGGSAGNNNLILKQRAVAPGETYTCPELVGQVMESGDFISTLAGAANSLTIQASGVEIT